MKLQAVDKRVRVLSGVSVPEISYTEWVWTYPGSRKSNQRQPQRLVANFLTTIFRS